MLMLCHSVLERNIYDMMRFGNSHIKVQSNCRPAKEGIYYAGLLHISICPYSVLGC